MLNTDVKEESRWFHHPRQMSLVFCLIHLSSSLFCLCLIIFQLNLKWYCILLCSLSSLNIITYIFPHIIKILNNYFNAYIIFNNYPSLLFKDCFLFATTINIAVNVSACKSFFCVLHKLAGLLFFFFKTESLS